MIDDNTLLNNDELGKGNLKRNFTFDGGNQEKTRIGTIRFMETLSRFEREVFVYRYGGLNSKQEIALCYGFSQRKTALMLHRIRYKLNLYLSDEG